MSARLGALALGAAALVGLPFVASEARLTRVGAYLVAIVGLDVLLRHGGRVSLGHGAFAGIGGYTTAILAAHHGVSRPAAIAAAVGVAGAAGLLGGVLLLRVTGRHLALPTLGLAIAFPPLAERLEGSGRIAFAAPSPGEAYAVTWVVAAGCLLLAWRLVGSRFGRSLRAARDSAPAAAASGVDRAAHEIAVFGLAAAYAGLAGALLALAAGGVEPGSFPARLSLILLAGAVAGLLGSIRGAAIGALLVEFAGDVAGAEAATVALGAVVVAAALALRVAARGYARPR